MPVTFGSVGDIIAVCLLVKDLVEALDKRHGSSAEYKAVKGELWVLERTLLEVERASRKFGSTPELNATCETTRHAVENCQVSVAAFSAKLKKYARTLGSGIPANPVSTVAAKVRWQVSEREELTKFRAEVAAHNSFISTLLVTAGMDLAHLNQNETNDLLDEQSKRLTELDSKLTENNHLVSSSIAAIMAKMTELLQLGRLRQIGTDLISLGQKVLFVHLATYKAVMEIQKGLPSHLERSLIQEPFILEDAIGRIFPVHLQFISSWEAFDAVLEDRFRNFRGYEKVRNSEYVLQDHSTRRDITRSRKWDAAFLPGQKIEMTMLFEELKDPHSSETTSCPGCKRVSDGGHDTEVHCASCGLRFKRITVVKTHSDGTTEDDGAANPMHGPSRTRRRKLNCDLQDNVADFIRVRLLSWHYQARRGANKRKTQPSQGDAILVGCMDPIWPDLARQAAVQALESGSDLDEDSSEDMDTIDGGPVAM